MIVPSRIGRKGEFMRGIGGAPDRSKSPTHCELCAAQTGGIRFRRGAHGPVLENVTFGLFSALNRHGKNGRMC